MSAWNLSSIQLGHNVRMCREHLGITLPELAKWANSSKSTISKLENGGNPTYETLICVSHALGVSLSDLMRWQGWQLGGGAK